MHLVVTCLFNSLSTQFPPEEVSFGLRDFPKLLEPPPLRSEPAPTHPNTAMEAMNIKNVPSCLRFSSISSGGNDLCGGWSGSAKEIVRDTLHIRIAVACISIFDLLMIRYSCI
nr:hypothetical protein CFP56_46416 [Quercus suber]